MFCTKNVYEVTCFNHSSGSTSYSVIVGVDISGGDFNPVTDSRISLIFRSISVCFSVSKKNSLFEVCYYKDVIGLPLISW